MICAHYQSTFLSIVHPHPSISMADYRILKGLMVRVIFLFSFSCITLRPMHLSEISRDVSDNKLTGVLPESWSSITRLQRLWVRSSKIWSFQSVHTCLRGVNAIVFFGLNLPLLVVRLISLLFITAVVLWWTRGYFGGLNKMANL